jgi:hypothetical protein
MLKRLLFVTPAILAIGVGALPMAGAATHKVFVARSIVNGQLAYKPHQIVLSADGTFSVNRIRWLRYGGPLALGTGRAYARGCRPSCAEGRVFRPRATLRLTRVIKCEGRYIYARLRFALRGHIPTGFHRRGSYPMRPTDESGEPAC